MQFRITPSLFIFSLFLLLLTSCSQPQPFVFKGLKSVPRWDSVAYPAAASRSIRSAASTDAASVTSGAWTPCAASACRISGLAPARYSLTPLLCALRASPSITFAPVESRNGTAAKSTIRARWVSEIRSSTDPIEAAAPKKNAPVIR